MTEEQLKQKIETILRKIKNGQEIENPKIDIKRQWFDLTSTKKPFYEFLKDTSAIANTFGEEGLIIIGFDEKEGKFYDSYFSDCGLKDTSHIYPLINKNIADPFDINIFDIELNGNFLSVIHLPASINKPHVIKNYKTFDKKDNPKNFQNEIFVRKSTGSYPASKYDLELMFYDKKNNIPEYEVRIDATRFNLLNNQNRGMVEETKLEIFFSIENLGRRALAINNISIKVFNDKENIDIEFHLKGQATSIGIANINNKAFIIKSNSIEFYNDLIFVRDMSFHEIVKSKIINIHSDYFMRLNLTNGKVLESKINITHLT